MPVIAILSVGLNPALLKMRETVLRAAGYVVESAISAEEAGTRFCEGDFDLVLLCRSMPAEDGGRLTSLIRATGSLIPVVSVARGSGQSAVRDGECSIEGCIWEFLPGVRAMVAKERNNGRLPRPDGTAEAMAGSQPTVLCVDDEPGVLQLRRALLERAGYCVLTTGDGAEGLEVFSTGVVDAAVVDYSMPGMNGGEVAGKMRDLNPAIPLILDTGYPTVPQEAVERFDRVVRKGTSPASLLEALEDVLRREKRRVPA